MTDDGIVVSKANGNGIVSKQPPPQCRAAPLRRPPYGPGYGAVLLCQLAGDPLQEAPVGWGGVTCLSEQNQRKTKREKRAEKRAQMEGSSKWPPSATTTII